MASGGETAWVGSSSVPYPRDGPAISECLTLVAGGPCPSPRPHRASPARPSNRHGSGQSHGPQHTSPGRTATTKLPVLPGSPPSFLRTTREVGHRLVPIAQADFVPCQVSGVLGFTLASLLLHAPVNVDSPGGTEPQGPWQCVVRGLRPVWGGVWGDHGDTKQLSHLPPTRCRGPCPRPADGPQGQHTPSVLGING